MVFHAQVKTPGVDANPGIQPAESSFVSQDNFESVDMPALPGSSRCYPQAREGKDILNAPYFLGAGGKTRTPVPSALESYPCWG